MPRMQNNWNFHTLLVGMQNCKVTLENGAVSYKITYLSNVPFSPDSKIFTPEIHLHKNLHTNIHSSFIHNCQKLETTQMSFNYLLNKGTMVHPYNGMPLSSTKKQSTGMRSNEGDSEMSYNDSSRTVRFCSCGIL